MTTDVHILGGGNHEIVFFFFFNLGKPFVSDVDKVTLAHKVNWLKGQKCPQIPASSGLLKVFSIVQELYHLVFLLVVNKIPEKVYSYVFDWGVFFVVGCFYRAAGKKNNLWGAFVYRGQKKS